MAACVKQIKALLLELPYIQEQIEHTRQIRRTAEACRYGIFGELDTQSSEGSENDQDDQEGHLEANGENNFWHLW